MASRVRPLMRSSICVSTMATGSSSWRRCGRRGNIATAVAAVKEGAVDYLAKPTDADAIERALLGGQPSGLPAPPSNPMTADRVRWEHIQRVFEDCDRNVSETARRLNMHRRTLQRILGKHAPRDR
jgi:two-component system response regulator RegA